MQDKMQFVAVRFPPLEELMFLARVSIGMPEEPNGIPQATWGDVAVRVRPQFRGRRDARDERERSGENARFHSHWLEKMRLYGVVMCAGTCIRAVGDDGGRSAPLRVQGHAECGHVRGVKLLGGTTKRVVFARARRRVRAMQAHRERRARIFFSYPVDPVIWLR